MMAKISSNCLNPLIESIIKNHFIFIYAVSTALFATVYYLYWYISPSAFIINPELNISTIKVIYHERNSFVEQPLILTKLSDYHEVKIKTDEKTRKNKIKIDTLNKLTNDLNIEIDKTYNELLEKLKINKSSAEKETTRYLNDKLKEQFTNLDILTKEVELRKRQLGDEYYTVLANDNEAKSKLKIEIAETKLEIAIAEKEFSDKFSSSMGDYHDKETFIKLNKLEDKENTYNKELLRLKHENEQIDNSFKDYTLTFEDQSRERINYIDFLYYSIGISTTTTFSDIVANDRCIRAIVMIQLIVSIFLLALILKKITKQ